MKYYRIKYVGEHPAIPSLTCISKKDATTSLSAIFLAQQRIKHNTGILVPIELLICKLADIDEGE